MLILSTAEIMSPSLMLFRVLAGEDPAGVEIGGASGACRALLCRKRLGEAEDAVRVVLRLDRDQAGVVGAVVGLGPVVQVGIGEVGVHPPRTPRTHSRP